MAYTTMKTWASLDILTAAELNTYMRDNIEYLKAAADSRVFCAVEVSRTSAQSIPTATDTDIIWQAESTDTNGWWAPASGATITVPAAAIPAGYTQVALLFIGLVRYVASGTGGRALYFLKNGTKTDSVSIGSPSATDPTEVYNTAFMVVAAGDLIKVQGRQSSGGALNMDVARVSIARFAPYA